MGNTHLYYALFDANPSKEPPFSITLGTGVNSNYELKDCKDIKDGIARIESNCREKNYTFSNEFVLLYPIYMDTMNTDNEGTMHQIAWLIKDEADAKNWKFDRIGGYTGKTPESFIN